jgi:hypothetical protein
MDKAWLWRTPCLVWVVLAMLASAHAEPAPVQPAQVRVGAYVANIQDVNFKDGRVTMDFYVWFRWKPDERLADYKPLESVELTNGEIKGKGSVVEKTQDGMMYASMRITARVYKTWEIDLFPFDRHDILVHLEDSRFDAGQLEFVPDKENSQLGDELALAGWKFSRFDIRSAPKVYDTNYGEIGRLGLQSSYSRASILVELRRDGTGPAVKLLMIAGIATLVAFVAFMIKPSNVDPRFGLGIGSLFAVAASALIVASTVPDSAVLTIADKVHILAMWLIFASLVQSAFSLKWAEAGRHQLYRRVDAWSLLLFPLCFLVASGWIIGRAFK